MQAWRELRVWQDAHRLLLQIYRATEPFPTQERYGLTAQLRRAALSVPTNIVEGSKRYSNPDFARFLNIAEASLMEPEYLLMVSHDLDYLPTEQWNHFEAQIDELAKMLHGLRARVEGRP